MLAHVAVCSAMQLRYGMDSRCQAVVSSVKDWQGQQGAVAVALMGLRLE